jgi:predicted porin
MQKKIIALAIAGLASTGALAQTNVTVYGILDAYYAYNSIDKVKGTTQDDSSHNIGSGGLSGSRLGFRGTEDLGGGLKANFVLEYAVQNDVNGNLGSDYPGNGTRQAFVGLEGKWGKVAIGRLQSAAYDWDCTTAPLAGSGLDAKSKLPGQTLLSCGGGGRVNNAVAYNSPNFSGFTFAVNHARVTENQNGISAPAAAGVSAENDANASMIGVGYNNGPLAINAVYTKLDNNVKPTGAAFVVKDVTEWGVSGSYNFGMLKLFGAWQTADQTVKSTTLSRQSDNDKWTVGVGVPVGAAGAVSVQYADASLDKCSGAQSAWPAGAPTFAGAPAAASAATNGLTNNCDSDAWTIAYTHNLSKRTTLYGGYIDVSNDANSVSNANGQAKTRAGGDASTIMMGVRHSF